MFKLKSKYSPSGDQAKAIKELNSYLDLGHKYQTLWWVTWSWKTFTMANLIEKRQVPTLIIAHNKTLAAQLALEFKDFFPDAAVHYFVSYYDYYQPEAYVSKTDTYIEKEATINEEIDRLRHAATQDLLSRRDVIIVASVSCIYGIWDIKSYREACFDIKVWKEYKMEELLKKLVSIQYRRSWNDFKPGNFQVMWDLLEIFPASEETVYSIEFWWDEVSQISKRNYMTGEVYEVLQEVSIFPAKHTVTSKDRIDEIVPEIEVELKDRLKYFKEDMWDLLKYERLKTKVEYDIEMMREVWYVNGIENYSSYLDGRNPWEAPATLMDFFPKDFLCFIDESHMTLSQIWAMYAWDRSRKENLVSNWFRLPSSLDNRPLQFDEFESRVKQIVSVSATPSLYEINKSIDDENLKKEKNHIFFNFNPETDGKWKSSDSIRIVPQVIRPTGLLDPVIELREMEFMVDDIMKNINDVIEKGERMLITTLTKRSSEELTDYLIENKIKVRYLHSEIDTLERLEIIKDLRLWKIDLIVWVNLLREGLDLPEVSKISILDADKQWFLRSESSLIQIIWRAARNSSGIVYMYSEKLKKFKLELINWEEKILVWDQVLNQESEGLFRLDKWKLVNRDWFIISNAMRKAISLTYYRRWLQKAYNEKNSVTPTTVYSKIKEIGIQSTKTKRDYAVLDKKSLEKKLAKLELEMDIAAANMEYEKAADLRDQIIELKKWKKK